MTKIACLYASSYYNLGQDFCSWALLRYPILDKAGRVLREFFGNTRSEMTVDLHEKMALLLLNNGPRNTKGFVLFLQVCRHFTPCVCRSGVCTMN